MNLIAEYNIYLIYKTLKLWLVNVSVVVKRVVKALVRRVSNYYSVKFKSGGSKVYKYFREA